jgi:site-specific DNA-methyltransferase (adenine-specific)
MADNSVDSIVTDPPYELGFMGKSWDSTGIAFNVEVWTEALRVLKPGGHLLAFSGSRTYHRMAVAIEDAGFQIRDQIMWLYGSGFPKSLDVSKAIDKAAGAVREVVGQVKNPLKRGTVLVGERSDASAGMFSGVNTSIDITAPSTPEAQQWAGWGTALKPAHEPIVLARKPLIGTVAANVLEHGTGGLNIDGSRVLSNDWDAEKVLGKYRGSNIGKESVTNAFGVGEIKSTNTESTLIGRFPANIIHDGSDEVLAGFPITSPARRSLMGAGGIPNGANNLVGSNVERNQDFESVRGFNDSGTAARFFYCAKASKRDRNEGLDGFEAIRVHDGRQAGNKRGSNPRNRTNDVKVNHHPTVKPTDLMRYLVKLITPPNGIVLDPFTGSGSTGKGAVIEGFNFIGIELDPDYVAIATARIQHQLDNIEVTLFTGETS